ncbi:helix-turn-helix transcriptional regulator [Candidatus Daviesbacteria bacterium]|nr:helix-turn-helix transcriptional regulator [Candidatus Daviesbacteria bacterium]
MFNELEHAITRELDQLSPGQTRYFLEGVSYIIQRYPERYHSNLEEEIILLGRFIENARLFPQDEDFMNRSLQIHGSHYSPGLVVRAWRNERALSLTELAKRSGPPITKAYLSALENGKIKRGIHDLQKILIANGLSINVRYLEAGVLPDNPSFNPPKRG